QDDFEHIICHGNRPTPTQFHRDEFFCHHRRRSAIDSLSSNSASHCASEMANRCASYWTSYWSAFWFLLVRASTHRACPEKSHPCGKHRQPAHPSRGRDPHRTEHKSTAPPHRCAGSSVDRTRFSGARQRNG